MASSSPFDDGLTDEEIQKARDLENAEADWKLVNERLEAKMYRYTKNTGKHRVTMCKAVFEGIPMDIMEKIINDMNIRGEWDTMAKDMKDIDILDDDTKIVYWVIKMPMPCSNRDVLLHAKTIRSPNETLIVYKNATHPKCPPKSSPIRADILLSSVRISSDKDDPNTSHLVFIQQFDLKGWLPASVVNFVAESRAFAMGDEMTDYYKKTYLKKEDQK
ncbi:START domain-containing protein 10-like [Oscarella lobularis]|uniref:START domain-containing protein 10-like n=1 Tax=Oscarella lobularis TaxID=121494 RepID=UPI00331430AF